MYTCIDNKGYEGFLILGKAYNIRDRDEERQWLEVEETPGCFYWYDNSRFSEVVDESCPVC